MHYIHRLKIATPVDHRTSELKNLPTTGDSGADATKVRQRSELEDSPTTGGRQWC